MYKILLANIENWDSIAEVPFIFKKAGCHIDVLCNAGSWSISNKYFDTWIDGKNNTDFIIETVIAKATTDAYDWIILADDNLVKLVSEKVNDVTLFKN